MEQRKNINLAIVSPNSGAYSETFIHAQKELLPFNIYYYSGGFFPTELESKSLRKPASVLFSFIRSKIIDNSKKKYIKVLALEHSLKKNKITVVLAQYGPTGESLADICQRLKIPLVVHFHGFDASDKNILEQYNNYKKIFSVAKAIIAVSQSMYSKLLELGCSRDKLYKVTYGPRDFFFEVNPIYSKPHFIGIGRFTNKKAPYYTILAFSKVLSYFPDARLIIGGSGELYNVCLNLIKYLKIEHAVELPGVLNQKEYMDYLSTSLAFVQHSITAFDGDSEGTPVAILEASAAGVPVISTKHAGIQDVVISGKTGILVDEHDVEGMTRAMIKVLENKHLAIEYGQAAKQRVSECFRMDFYIDNLSKIIISSCSIV